jgi:hypothetical protein
LYRRRRALSGVRHQLKKKGGPTLRQSFERGCKFEFFKNGVCEGKFTQLLTHCGGRLTRNSKLGKVDYGRFGLGSSKAQFNGVGELQTYISFTHSAG